MVVQICVTYLFPLPVQTVDYWKLFKIIKIPAFNECDNCLCWKGVYKVMSLIVLQLTIAVIGLVVAIVGLTISFVRFWFDYKHQIMAWWYLKNRRKQQHKR